MTNIELTKRSLTGLWVGDCIGNIGQLYFAHDILKALDEGLMKFNNNVNSMGQHFHLSDDTEEAVVLVNHLYDNGQILQNKYAFELAKRFYERDPDGEIFGYGLMTRTVLKEIYQGKDWREANQTKPRIEAPSFVDKMIGGIADGKSIKDAMTETNAELQKELANKPELKIGSCGNGSAMRVAPLGAFVFENAEKYSDPIAYLIEQARLQSEVTHCHPEGIAGSIAVSLFTYYVSKFNKDLETYHFLLKAHTPINVIYDFILKYTPKGKVYDGIVTASTLPLDMPLMQVIEKIGNGTHVTCQDTVPLCIYLVVKALYTQKIENMYESAIIDTCKCFGDVDTNCAIVGGIIGVIAQPPEKWIRYCQPMEGVLGEPLPEGVKKSTSPVINKNAIKEAMSNTTSDIVAKEVDEVYEMEYDNPELKKPIDFMDFIKTRKKTV